MTFTVEEVVERLADAGVRLERGLTEADLKRVEQKFGFAFGPGHRALLRAALPLGDAWLNWRHASPARIRERLQAPIEAIVADVRDRDFWPASWGARPGDAQAAEQAARKQLADVPVLVPLYGRHFLPAAPAPETSPVLSVSPGEVTVHGADLLDYVALEFAAGARTGTPAGQIPRVAFWSDLADGAASSDL